MWAALKRWCCSVSAIAIYWRLRAATRERIAADRVLTLALDDAALAASALRRAQMLRTAPNGMNADEWIIALDRHHRRRARDAADARIDLLTAIRRERGLAERIKSVEPSSAARSASRQEGRP